MLSAPEAAALLGVKLATLYSYASRGVVTSHRRPDRRGSWFDPAELDRVARRSRSGSSERLSDMQFQSSITLVEGGRFFYRGHDPAVLVSAGGFESVADVLWGVERASWAPDADGVAAGRAAVATLGRPASVLDRLRVAAPAVGAVDPLRFDLRPDAVAQRAGRMLMTLVSACLTSPLGPHATSGHSYADAVASLLGLEPGTSGTAGSTGDGAGSADAGSSGRSGRILDAAMILLADHEIAASTAAVRIAASFRADPYAAVGSGLAVLSGAYHGAASVAVSRLLDEASEVGVVAAVGEMLRRGEVVPGLGQVLYPDGDPRFAVLMGVLRNEVGNHDAIAVADEVEDLAAERGFPPPNVDFAIATATRVLGLGSRAGETIFAVARMVGWLAHAIEEYSERTALRLRANYVGPRP